MTITTSSIKAAVAQVAPKLEAFYRDKFDFSSDRSSWNQIKVHKDLAETTIPLEEQLAMLGHLPGFIKDNDLRGDLDLLTLARLAHINLAFSEYIYPDGLKVPWNECGKALLAIGNRISNGKNPDTLSTIRMLNYTANIWLQDLGDLDHSASEVSTLGTYLRDAEASIDAVIEAACESLKDLDDVDVQKRTSAAISHNCKQAITQIVSDSDMPAVEKYYGQFPLQAYSHPKKWGRGKVDVPVVYLGNLQGEYDVSKLSDKELRLLILFSIVMSEHCFLEADRKDLGRRARWRFLESTYDSNLVSQFALAAFQERLKKAG